MRIRNTGNLLEVFAEVLEHLGTVGVDFLRPAESLRLLEHSLRGGILGAIHRPESPPWESTA